ncbi:terminase small subunit [Podophage Lau218]|uniref:Phage protein n=2 Tax=Lauvirus lau218 TaxID=1465639 RepID=A0A060BRT5_9CAUD|nr:terminase small subunit [Podophage Lau218]AIA83163.1 phage protein [Podophage Lau218]AIA83211.1 phage protein [Lauvirus lau218]AIA83262.1 phage protein [Lauvirus lau218]
MAKASVEQLNSLHDLVAKHYTTLLSSGEVKSSDLNAINAFLKNNDVSADVIESKPMMSLVEEIKDSDLIDIIKFG